MTNLPLPEPLERFRTNIEKSIQPFVRISTQPAGTGGQLSRFGGYPYLPAGFAYPQDAQGKPMQLLAQINFAEVPPLPDFPQEGLLQIYIADERMYGLNLDEPTKQEGFTVVFHPAVAADQQETDGAPVPEFTHTPVLQPAVLTFELKEAPVGTEDVHFDAVFNEPAYELFEELDNGTAVKQAYQQLAAAGGHKIGGYAHFTQEDPRWVHEDYAEAVLLLQIDSEDGITCWGDMGIAQFFILAEDLEKQDFSRVLYNWDSP